MLSLCAELRVLWRAADSAMGALTKFLRGMFLGIPALALRTTKDFWRAFAAVAHCVFRGCLLATLLRSTRENNSAGFSFSLYKPNHKHRNWLQSFSRFSSIMRRIRSAMVMPSSLARCA